MSNKLIYYVYAYLRSKDSATAAAGTPYYIGKGCGRRHKQKHLCGVPSDLSLIVFLETNLTEIGALALERQMILWYGRVDLGTGILRNLTDGGESSSGYKHTETHKKQMSITMAGKNKGKPSHQKGKPIPTEQKQKIATTLTGRVFSDASKAKMSAGKKGKPAHNKGVPQTLDAKIKQQETWARKKSGK